MENLQHIHDVRQEVRGQAKLIAERIDRNLLCDRGSLIRLAIISSELAALEADGTLKPTLPGAP